MKIEIVAYAAIDDDQGSDAPGLLVPILLRPAAVAVGSGAGIDQVHVRHLVQVLPESPPWPSKHLAQVARLLGLGVGLVGDADVEVEGRLPELGERLAADEPGVGGDVLHGDRDHRQLLAEHGLGELGYRIDHSCG